MRTSPRYAPRTPAHFLLRRLAPGLLTLAVLPLASGCRNAARPTPGPDTEAKAVAEPVANAQASPGAPAVRPPSPGARIEDERNTISVFRDAAPATVFVTQTQLVTDGFFGTAKEVKSGSGSGFVWDKAGHIVTNFHVVKGARRLTVTFQNHKTYPATIRGVEPRKDIAVLKIGAPAKDLRPIHVPKHMKLEVGQKTVAIGNPFGLDHTLTTGVVSALGREVDGIGGVTIRDMIQTDAAINPGNSGGPLLDSSGQLIGMNTMIFSRSGASAGIGFAVPVSTIARVVPQIIKTGHAEQLGLGVMIDPQARLERQLGLRGVVVLKVPPTSPAAKAGIRGIQQTPQGLALGDVIVGIDGTKVDDYDDLYNLLDRQRSGKTVEVELRRGKTTVKVKTDVIVLE